MININSFNINESHDNNLNQAIKINIKPNQMNKSSFDFLSEGIESNYNKNTTALNLNSSSPDFYQK